MKLLCPLDGIPTAFPVEQDVVNCVAIYRGKASRVKGSRHRCFHTRGVCENQRIAGTCSLQFCGSDPGAAGHMKRELSVWSFLSRKESRVDRRAMSLCTNSPEHGTFPYGTISIQRPPSPRCHIYIHPWLSVHLSVYLSIYLGEKRWGGSRGHMQSLSLSSAPLVSSWPHTQEGKKGPWETNVQLSTSSLQVCLSRGNFSRFMEQAAVVVSLQRKSKRKRKVSPAQASNCS